MININTESLLRMREALEYLATRGIKTTRATLYRWASPIGVEGVRLETLVIGGRRHTSKEALQRFCVAVTRNHDFNTGDL